MEKIRFYVETIGIIAVVLSLIFVGFQLRLEQKMALGAQYQGRAEITSSNIQAFIQSEAALSRIAKDQGYVEENGYTPEEQAIRFLSLWMAFIAWDNVEYQYQLGLLEEDWWAGTRKAFKEEMRQPDRRKYFEENVERESFRKFIEEVGQEIDRE